MKTLSDAPEWYKQLEVEPHTVYTFSDQLAGTIKMKANQRKNSRWPVPVLPWLFAIMIVGLVGLVALNYNVLKEKAYPVYQDIGHLLGFAEGENNLPASVPIRPDTFLQQVKIDLEYAQAVQKGHIPGIEYGIGSSRQELVSAWGQPDLSIPGTDQWGNYVFHYDIHDEKVGGVVIQQESITISLEEVKQRLGSPTEEGEAQTDSRWVLYYLYDDYGILFYGNEVNRKVTSISIIQTGNK